MTEEAHAHGRRRVPSVVYALVAGVGAFAVLVAGLECGSRQRSAERQRAESARRYIEVLARAPELDEKQRERLLGTPRGATAERLLAVMGSLFEENPDLVDAKDEIGLPLVRIAAVEGNVSVLTLLLDHGADPNTRVVLPAAGDLGTLLHAAATNESTAAAELLIERGADINARNQFGQTPLHAAVRGPHRTAPKMVEFLLDKGAKIDAVDKMGYTPLLWIEKSEYAVFSRGVIAVLKKRGAKGPPALAPVATPGKGAPVARKARTITLWAWGGNRLGQLGTGRRDFDGVPTPARIGTFQNVRQIVAGSQFVIILTGQGEVTAWGACCGYARARLMPLPKPLNNVVQISAGDMHALALRTDGSVVAWGWNTDGRCGDGTKFMFRDPVKVKGLTDVKAVAAGSSHSLALKKDGTVWAWGDNSYASLGDGTTTSRLTPVQVKGLDKVVTIAAGGGSLAVRSDGTVWQWGASGMFADGKVDKPTVPWQVKGLKGVKSVADGPAKFALLEDGTLWAWDDNRHRRKWGKPGDTMATPVRLKDLGKVTAIAGGVWHALALKADGTVWTWGFNMDGQLGDGTRTDRDTTPAMVRGPAGITGVMVGGNSSFAIRDE